MRTKLVIITMALGLACEFREPVDHESEGGSTGGESTGGDGASSTSTGTTTGSSSGQESSGESTSGESTGGESTGGESTGGESTGGESTGGESTSECAVEWTDPNHAQCFCDGLPEPPDRCGCSISTQRCTCDGQLWPWPTCNPQ